MNTYNENLIFDTRIDTQKIYVSMKTKFVPRKYPGKKNAPLYLHITGLGERERLHLDVEISLKHWDSKKSRLLVSDSYQKHIDTNLIIDNIEAKVTNIKTVYRLSEQVLTPYKLKKELINDLPRVNFCAFWENALKAEKNKLKNGSYRKIKSVLKKVKEYNAMIIFSDMNLNWFDKYRLHLYKLGNKKTTVNSNLKIIKKYVKLAVKSGIKVPFNLDDVKIGSTAGTRVSLDTQEVLKLQKYYYSDFINKNHQLIIGYFLFSCYTGLRFSDVVGLSREDVEKNYIQFKSVKVDKMQNITLNKSAKKLIDFNRKLFELKFTNQFVNQELKIIAKSLGITKKVTFHISRHTFATSFLRAGGKVEKLQQLLGHSDLKQVMVYSHIVAEEANEEIFLLDNLF